VKVALFQGYDPNLIGLYQWSALHEAANNGEVEILKNLLKNKG
jgi:ankyrin repeat protein